MTAITTDEIVKFIEDDGNVVTLDTLVMEFFDGEDSFSRVEAAVGGALATGRLIMVGHNAWVASFLDS